MKTFVVLLLVLARYTFFNQKIILSYGVPFAGYFFKNMGMMGMGKLHFWCKFINPNQDCQTIRRNFSDDVRFGVPVYQNPKYVFLTIQPNQTYSTIVCILHFNPHVCAFLAFSCATRKFIVVVRM